MRRFFRSAAAAFLAAVLMLYISGCSEENPGASVRVQGQNPAGAEDVRGKYTALKGDGTDTVTVMVYMVGSDLETEDGCASSDLAEMLQADLGSRMNLVLQTGGTKSWTDRRISAGTCQRWRIRSGELEQIGDAGDVDMSQGRSLSDFISFAADACPADRYCLILWNHGGGAISGFGYDERYDSEMMPLEAIDAALTKAAVHFDFVGFDACLMATIETAFMLERHADYLIASEETEPGSGWAYTGWLTALGADPAVDTVTLGQKIVDDFTEDAGNFEAATLSVVDLRYIPAAYERLCTFLSEARDKITDDGDYKTFSVARAEAKAYGEGDFEQIDVQDYVLRTGLPDAQEVCSLISRAVCYQGGTVAGASGLAMYFPYKALRWYDGMHDTLSAIGMGGEYTAFFDCFVSVMAAGQVNTSAGPFAEGREENFESYTWYDKDAVESYSDFYSDEEFLELPIQEKGDGYVLSLSEEQWGDIVGIELQVYLDDGNGYCELGSDPVFEFDEDSDLMILYDGYWVAVNGQIIPFFTESYDEYDDGSWTNYGYAPCSVNGVDKELVLYWGDDCPDGTVLGYRNVTEIGGPAAKGVYSLTDGDVISFYTDRFDYEGTFVRTADFGRTIVVDGGLDVSYEYVGDGECIVYYMLTDIYGNHSWTESVIAA